MKETSANVNTDVRKFYLSEFSYDDGEYEIIFNILEYPSSTKPLP